MSPPIISSKLDFVPGGGLIIPTSSPSPNLLFDVRKRAKEMREVDKLVGQLPFKVMLHVEWSPGEIKPQTVFTRSPAPASAGNLAYALWKRWFRDDAGIPSFMTYPSVKMSGEVIVLDEGDWNGYLKEVQRMARNNAKGADGKPLQLKYAQAGPNMPITAWAVYGLNFDMGNYTPRNEAMKDRRGAPVILGE